MLQNGSGVAITSKADVYSYGMMLFELVSCKRNTKPFEDGRVKFFPTWATNVVIQGSDMLSLLDPRLEGNADREQVARIVKVAAWCVQDDESHRPSMGQVVQILEGILDLDLPPIPRSLELFVEDQKNVVFFTTDSNSSSNLKGNIVSPASSQA